MQQETHLSWEGIQLVWVVMGLFGALLGIGSMPKMSKRQLWSSLGSAIFCAGEGPNWANWAFVHFAPAWANPDHLSRLPDFMFGTAAFVCGIGGLFFIPVVIAFWRDPLGTILRVTRFFARSRTTEGGDAQ